MRGGSGCSLLLLAALAGCAPKNWAPKPKPLPEPSAAELRSASERINRLHRELARCESLRRRPIPFEEERLIGEKRAIDCARENGGFWVDVPDGLSLQESMALPSPPDTAANRLQRYVNLVGMNLGAQSPRPTLPWTFGVLRSDEARLCVGAGGLVLVTAGLLRLLENEAELAGVLGNGIGQVVLKSHLEVASKTREERCRLELMSEAGRKLNPEVTLQLATPHDERQAETLRAARKMSDELMLQVAEQSIAESVASQLDWEGADRLSAELLISAGYDPGEYLKLLGRLPEDKGPGTGIPPNAGRQAALSRWLAGLRPSAAGFSPYADWPFRRYKRPPLGAELAVLRR
ncbi:MAG: hypothetical protein HYZ28_19800 [Myxococcales bacterium]|nr:hypothetical protein [Myxococcales bacterium]